MPPVLCKMAKFGAHPLPRQLQHVEGGRLPSLRGPASCAKGCGETRARPLTYVDVVILQKHRCQQPSMQLYRRRGRVQRTTLKKSFGRGAAEVQRLICRSSVLQLGNQIAHAVLVKTG